MNKHAELETMKGAETSECAQDAPESQAKPAKHPGDTRVAAKGLKRSEGIGFLPSDLRAFLRNRSVTEIAKVLSLGKGTASRIKRGIYPHTPQKLLKRWEAASAGGATVVGSWSLRRVMPSAAAQAAVLFGGEFYSGAGLVGMAGRQIVVARTSGGALLAQTLEQPVERFPLVRIEA